MSEDSTPSPSKPENDAPQQEQEQQQSPPAGDSDASAPAGTDPYSQAAAKHDDSDADKGEIWNGRPSFKTLLGQWALYVVVVVALLILALAVLPAPRENSFWDVVLDWFLWLVVLLPLLWLGFRTLYLRWSVRYRLTSQRLFIDRGILSRTTDQLELIRVDDISVRRSIIDRMVGLGNVIIRSTDASDPELVMRGIEKADDVAEHIRTHMRRLRGRGLYVESL
jgi:membrane protein YdbS with pleckstrin-like domain